MITPFPRAGSAWAVAIFASLGVGLPALAHAQTPAPDAAPVTTPTEDVATSIPPTTDAPATPAPGSTPSTTAPQAAQPTATAVDVDSAVAAALAAQAPVETPADEYKLSLYGFTDFTYTQHLNNPTLSLPYSTFAVGNLNLYLSAELGDSWRSLTEVRFMYLPDGNTPVGFGATPPRRQDTTVSDYADINRPVRWGGILIERAWLEHTFHPLLTVRGGQFLSPYGIWNVDHGTPVIIGARRPFVVGEALIPERQTGLEIYGTMGIDALQLGYHLTLSNGRGPIDTYQDLNNNKAIGGRLFAKWDSPYGMLSVGGSFYRGTYTDRQDAYSTNAKGEFVVVHNPTLVYDELSLAADVKWELSGFLLQAEAMTNDIAYDNSTRPVDPGFSGGPPGFVPDHRRWGAYALTGYRTKFVGTMPFFGSEYYNLGQQAFFPKAAAIWGGLNVRPTPRVVLKAQYTYSWFPGLTGQYEHEHYNALDFQAAWSF